MPGDQKLRGVEELESRVGRGAAADGRLLGLHM